MIIDKKKFQKKWKKRDFYSFQKFKKTISVLRYETWFYIFGA